MENFSTESANYTNISYLETSNGVKTFSSLVPATMFATGVFGNSFALFVLCNSPKDQRRTIFYRLVAALAFNDLLGTTATSPIVLLVYSKGRWIGGQPLCDYFSFILIFAGKFSILFSIVNEKFVISAIRSPLLCLVLIYNMSML
jgi:prostaglandin E receptor 4